MANQQTTKTNKLTRGWLLLLVWAWLVPLLAGSQSENRVVVVTSDYTHADEIEAMAEMMTEWSSEPRVIHLSELSKEHTDWADCVVYHRSDTTNITPEEAALLG